MAGYPIWALEESVEDAFVAYFKSNMPGEVDCKAGFSTDEITFPALGVMCTDSENADEGAFSGHRKVTVLVKLGVEAIAQTDAGGVPIQNARERNRALRGAMIDAVARNDLAAELNAINSPKVKFSYAQLESAQRSVEEGRILATDLTIECIANPQETE